MGPHVAGSLAINLFEFKEPIVRPVESDRLVQNDVRNMGRDFSGQWELWPWPVLFGLVVIVIEWWAHFRGVLLLGINLS